MSRIGRLPIPVPSGVTSVTALSAPQPMTQLPPGSRRALPQHDAGVVIAGSVICSTMVAVFAVVSIA